MKNFFIGDLGVYQGETAQSAFLAMVRDAGYDAPNENTGAFDDYVIGLVTSETVSSIPDEQVWAMVDGARERVGAWKARREGNIDDDVAAAVYALDDRYPGGWNLDTFKACLEMIEEGVSPSLAADEA